MRVETVILYGHSLYWFGNSSQGPGTSLIAQLVKSPPAMQETLVRLLGWEDPLERGMAIHSSVLVWRSPSSEEPHGLQSMESQTVGHD